MGAPFYPRRQQIAVKTEVTEGTDSVPTDTDVVAPAYDIEWTPEFNMDARDVQQASFSHLAQVAGERSAQISFATELKGSGTAGTAPVNLSAALQACGMSETLVAVTSATYAPVSESLDSVTIEIREGSADTVFKSKKIVGARGTFVIEAVKGSIVLVRFTFTGRYIEPTDATAFTTPSPGETPQPFLNVGFSFLGVSLKVQNCNIDIGNNIVLRNDANEVSGNFSAVQTGRNPVANIDPEQEDVSVENFFSELTSNTEGILTYALTGAAGNITTINAPKAQIMNAADGDRDDTRIETLDLQLNQNVDAGDDEFTIAFT